MGNWVDLIVVALFGISVALGIRRGFGRAVFDLAAVLVAIRLAYALCDSSSPVRIINANQALAFAIPFVVLGTVFWYLGKLVYETTLISAEVFDHLLGGICGLLIGITLDHAFARTLAATSTGEHLPRVLSDSILGTEVLRFDTYYRVIEWIYTFLGS